MTHRHICESIVKQLKVNHTWRLQQSFRVKNGHNSLFPVCSSNIEWSLNKTVVNQGLSLKSFPPPPPVLQNKSTFPLRFQIFSWLRAGNEKKKEKKGKKKINLCAPHLNPPHPTLAHNNFCFRRHTPHSLAIAGGNFQILSFLSARFLGPILFGEGGISSRTLTLVGAGLLWGLCCSVR